MFYNRATTLDKGFVYIMASRRNGTLYVGVTNDLLRRVAEHKAEVDDGFTKRYGVKTLVYFEIFDNFTYAIQREKQLKSWRRAWKIALIERDNKQWRDLSDDIGLNEEIIAAVANLYKQRKNDV